MEKFLSGDLIVGLVILFMFLLVMRRMRKKPGLRPQEWDLAYDFVTEPATTDNEDYKKTFDGISFPVEDNVHLVRLAFLNRGTKHIPLDKFKDAVRVHIPDGAEILEAKFNERFRSTLPAADDPRVDGQTLTIAPFALEPEGILIFNLVLKGASEPESVEAALEDQEEVNRLGLKFRFMRQ